MAKLTKFLGQVVGGVFGSEGDMRDYQHAARLFTDNFNALAPKVEFLYHVFFDINPDAARSPGGNIGWSKLEPRIETGMLVKACNVPGVQINTETKNQYGKKTNIQTQVQYTPVNITFHDDNTNLISGMWQQYFKTYYADSNYPDDLARQPVYNGKVSSAVASAAAGASGATGKPKSTKSPTISDKYSFGLNDYQTGHFFNKISIYQLTQHRFYEYTLINPIITSWQGPQLNSASSNPAENQMTIIYEGIKYAQGRVTKNSPDGFALLHYDNTPSPLSIMGGGSASLFGQNGVIAGGLDVFGDLMDPNVTSNPLALIGTAIKAKNTYDNAKKLTKDGIKNEITNVAVGATLNTVEQTVRIQGLNKANQTLATQVDTQPTSVWDPTTGQVESIQTFDSLNDAVSAVNNGQFNDGTIVRYNNNLTGQIESAVVGTNQNTGSRTLTEGEAEQTVPVTN